MPNYLLLYYDGDSAKTKKQRRKKLIAWEEQEIANALVDNGATEEAMAVKRDETKKFEQPELQGFSIIKADSWEEAVEISSGAPIIKEGGKVSVYKTDRTGN